MRKAHNIFFLLFNLKIYLIILSTFPSVDSLSQSPGNLYEQTTNHVAEYIIQQQAQLFAPVYTHNGFIENPAVMNARQIVYSPNLNTPNSSQQIIQQQNKVAAQMMGFKLPPTQADIQNQLRQRINGKAPEMTDEQKNWQEITNLLNDIHNREPATNEYWKTPSFASKEKPYYEALNKLKQQLLGQRAISVADAYYEIEFAEGNTMITKQEFKSDIDKSAQFIKRWMAENNLNANDNLSVHLAIQKFMSETLTIGKQIIEMPSIQPIKHVAFYYDYDDYKAEKDDRSYHVSKGFATGNGQCHILPLIYSCLAEALNTKFYLSYAPLHSFISYPDNTGTIHNYEVTTNWEISDQWYKENMGVTSLAENKQIYLNRMNRKQIVAAAIIDLAFSFKKKNGIADGKFINECIDFAMNYFPNKESNIAGWLMRGEITAAQLDRLLSLNKIKDINQAKQLPEAKVYMDKLNNINNKIESLGYTEEDNNVYEQMVEESKKKHPDLQNKNNLQKRNLFVPLN